MKVSSDERSCSNQRPTTAHRFDGQYGTGAAGGGTGIAGPVASPHPDDDQHGTGQHGQRSEDHADPHRPLRRPRHGHRHRRGRAGQPPTVEPARDLPRRTRDRCHRPSPPSRRCRPSPRINQHPAGQFETVAVRVVRLRVVVTDGCVSAAVGFTAAQHDPIDVEPGGQPGRGRDPMRAAAQVKCRRRARMDVNRRTFEQLGHRCSRRQRPATADRRSRRDRSCTPPGRSPGRGAAIAGDSISRIATGSTVVSRVAAVDGGARCDVVNGQRQCRWPSPSGNSSRLRPLSSGVGTSTTVETPSTVTVTRVIMLCCSSTACVNTNDEVGTVGSSGMFNVEPITSENGDVHAVVGSRRRSRAQRSIGDHR